jgi:hypothetical protein
MVEWKMLLTFPDLSLHLLDRYSVKARDPFAGCVVW